MRIAILLVAGVAVLGLAWWLLQGEDPVADPHALPASVDDAALDEHNRGIAQMGRFDFAAAVAVLEPLSAAHPDWLDCRIDLGIALLNRSRPDTKDLDRALAIMLDVLRLRPGDLRARQCTGILLSYRGLHAKALPYFEAVATADPEDGHAANFAGDCLYQMDEPEASLRWYEEARERDPYLRTAYYGAFRAHRALGRVKEAQAALATFQRMEINPQSRVAEIKYTRMGRHALVRGVRRDQPPTRVPEGPVFADAVGLPELGVEVFRAGEAPAAGAADLDGDGSTDLFLCGSAGSRVYLRRDDAFVPQPDHPLAAVADVRCALFGDVDNDGRVDAYLCRKGPNELWMRGDGDTWTRADAGADGGAHDTRDGALLDVDHDGDLDIVLLHGDAPFAVLANRLDGSFAPLPEAAGLRGRDAPASGLVACDLDRDRDLDLVFLHASGGHEVFRNDRLWRWEAAGDAYAALAAAPGHAGVATDADADGLPEITLAGPEGLVQLRRDDEGAWRRAARADGAAASLAVLDADGDGALELLVAHASGWRLHDPEGLGATEIGGAGARPALVHWGAAAGYGLLTFDDAGTPRWHAPGPGRHAQAALLFSGLHHESDQMRSNADGRGVRVAVRLGTTWTVHDTYRPNTGPGQSRQPLAIGLAGRERIDFVRLLWSDGLLQTETDLAPAHLLRIEETQRQTSSCPVLFAWDGSKFAFVTDLLGVGGVGFWVAPGTYAPPAPQETLLLPPGTLVPNDGRLHLKLGEPMEEACYLDHAALEQVDLPPGWHVTVDDRMAVLGLAPTGKLVFHRAPRMPATAVDQAGRDVRAALLEVDSKAAPAAPLDPRFIGRTEEHVLTLTFDAAIEKGPGPVWLLADGWIEYPYAQTLFSSWQAGAEYRAPTIEARGADGRWQTVHEQYGYPAGMPRRSAVPLPGLPSGTRMLRIRTTQEIYWDRLAIAYEEPCPEARRHGCALTQAELLFSGFARRTTAPQRLPHYDYADRPPLWDARHQRGFHTRFGPVEELVTATDDAVVIFGPGEEVDMRFAAPRAPVPDGWSRWSVLRTTGWCKDMDMFTKDGETVGPLPVRAASGEAHPARARLHPKYQTRYRSGR